ncbi:MAG: GntR family transcriptional regulator [Actinobacteria bacterium]|nr:GntR family transcriptional regulator [Actinomycetota bacterium]
MTDQDVPVKQAIVAELREDIISGELRPGEKLSEARLARRFGVSRTPVREAFKELESEDLVTIERRRGTFVTRLTRAEVMELYTVRAALEGMAARLCAERMTDETLKDLDEIMAGLQEAVDADDGPLFLARDKTLHERIFAGAGNSMLTQHYSLLSAHMQRERLGSLVTRRPGRLARSLAEHQQILRAIADRDGPSAELAMRMHVQHGREELAAALTEQGAADSVPAV